MKVYNPMNIILAPGSVVSIIDMLIPKWSQKTWNPRKRSAFPSKAFCFFQLAAKWAESRSFAMTACCAKWIPVMRSNDISSHNIHFLSSGPPARHRPGPPARLRGPVLRPGPVLPHRPSGTAPLRGLLLPALRNGAALQSVPPARYSGPARPSGPTNPTARSCLSPDSDPPAPILRLQLWTFHIVVCCSYVRHIMAPDSFCVAGVVFGKLENDSCCSAQCKYRFKSWALLCSISTVLCSTEYYCSSTLT